VPILGALKSLFELCSVAQACIGEFGSPDSSRAANGSRFAVRLEGMTSAIGCPEFSVGRDTLRQALCHYESHYHEERNHQGKDNVLLFPLPTQAVSGERGKVRCRERLGGLGEILREGIGIKVDETAGHGITISIY